MLNAPFVAAGEIGCVRLEITRSAKPTAITTEQGIAERTPSEAVKTTIEAVRSSIAAGVHANVAEAGFAGTPPRNVAPTGSPVLFNDCCAIPVACADLEAHGEPTFVLRIFPQGVGGWMNAGGCPSAGSRTVMVKSTGILLTPSEMTTWVE
jgi:hypothetical protein